jgi:competence protein ComEC
LTPARSQTGRLYLALAFVCLGIGVGWTRAFVIPAVAGVIVGLLWMMRGRRPAIALAIACFCAGGISAGLRANRASALADLASSAPQCKLSGTVTEASSLGTFARVRVAECEGVESIGDPGTVVIAGEEVDAGERFSASGFLTPLRDEDSFDVARSRMGADALFTARDVRLASASGLPRLALGFQRSLQRASDALSPRTAAMLLGLTVGETSGFDEPTLDAFRASGLAHLLAVSGSNVAIVVGTLAVCLRRARLSLRLGVSALGLAFYVLVVGPDASVVRAAAMGAAGLAALFWGHRPEPMNALAAAVIVVLLLRPALLFSVGLHLSAAATAGLVLWSQPLAVWLGRKLPAVIAWPLGATLAAQIAVAPVLVIAFERLSLVAPIANLLAVPAVAPATVLGLLSGAVGVLGPAPGHLAAATAGPAASWIVRCADFFGTKSWAQIELPAAAGWVLLGVVGVGAVITAGRTLGHLD